MDKSERAASDRRLQRAAGRNFCRVCSASMSSALITCSQDCARVAYIADAITNAITSALQPVTVTVEELGGY